MYHYNVWKYEWNTETFTTHNDIFWPTFIGETNLLVDKSQYLNFSLLWDLALNCWFRNLFKFTGEMLICITISNISTTFWIHKVDVFKEVVVCGGGMGRSGKNLKVKLFNLINKSIFINSYWLNILKFLDFYLRFKFHIFFVHIFFILENSKRFAYVIIGILVAILWK